MKHILFPIYNRLIKPTNIIGISSMDEDGQFKFHNFSFGNDTPFYKYEKEDRQTVLESYKDHEVLVLFKKGLYNLPDYQEITSHWKDLNTLLWMYNKEIIDFFYDTKKYIYTPLAKYSKTLRNLVNASYFDSLYSVYYPENIEHLLKASSKIDGSYKMKGKKFYKYFDHYTKGSRFRDVISNSISIESSKRADIETKGVGVYVDIDSYHLRLIDQILGGYIPRNERGHDWLMKQVFKEGKLPDVADQKKLVFTALYSENFSMLPCEFTEEIQMNKYKFKSPFKRKKIPFNYIIQEMDVLQMSKYINKLQSDKSEILLYLYDGLYFDVEKNYLNTFLNKAKDIIDLPFRVNIDDEEIRINFE